jgi:hypothetical protein
MDKRVLCMLLAAVLIAAMIGPSVAAGAGSGQLGGGGGGPATAHIIVKKFDDANINGVRDGGEKWLAGFNFELWRLLPNGEWKLEKTGVTSGINGQWQAGMYPFGWYKLVEVLTPAQIAEGWVPTTGIPLGTLVFKHTAEINSEKWFGNCIGAPQTCYQDETAWAAGDRYVDSNWATYVAYEPGKVVDIIAGQNMPAGTATFSAPAGGMIDIEIRLANGFVFFCDSDVPDDNVKVQDYAVAPTTSPSPGLFDWKEFAEVGSTSYTISVPVNSFYGVHLDVACPVDCQQ